MLVNVYQVEVDESAAGFVGAHSDVKVLDAVRRENKHVTGIHLYTTQRVQLNSGRIIKYTNHRNNISFYIQLMWPASRPFTALQEREGQH